MKEPVRLLTSGSPGARELLRSARGDAPSPAQLGRLGAKLGPVVVAAPTASTLLPWLLAGAAVLGVVGIVVVAHDRPAPALVAPAASAPAPLPGPAPAPAHPPAVEPRVQAPEVVAPPPVPKQSPPPVIDHKVAPAVEPTPALPREMDLLTPALEALRTNDPARALALAERHATLYARGAFAEEREAIAIEALQRLGQHDRARARLAGFAASYPRSSYRPRLDRLVRE